MLPLLTIAAICAILILACELTFRITGDRVSSLFASLSIASTYIGSFALISYYDAIALAQLVLAMLPGLNLWSKTLLVFTASFTDERAFVASAFLLLPSLCIKAPAQNRFFKPEFIAVLGGMAAYCVARIAVMKCTGLSTPHTGINFYLFILQIKFLHVGTWFALEGGWLWVAAAALILWRAKNWLALGLMLLIMGTLLTGSFMVADVLRSAAYLLPVVFVALTVLAKAKQIATLRLYCFLAFFISLVGGNYNIFGDRIIWCKPLPVAIFEIICEIIQAFR